MSSAALALEKMPPGIIKQVLEEIVDRLVNSFMKLAFVRVNKNNGVPMEKQFRDIPICTRSTDWCTVSCDRHSWRRGS